MIVDVVMPKLGESIVEGTILEWKVKVGDTIGRDAVLLEISTDKVDSEIPSPAEGIVTELLFEPQDTVDVGVVIARINTAGEGAEAVPAVAEEGAEAPAPAEPEEAPPAPQSEPPPPPPAAPPALISPSAISPGPSVAPTNGAQARRFYSPVVRSIAAREGVTEAELATLTGSGRSGRVNKADLLAYLAHRTSAPVVPSGAARPVPVPMGELIDEIIPMDRVRKRIAQHMRQSLDTSTHVYGITESDVTNMVGFRSRHKGRFQQSEGLKLTYTPLIAFATLRAIRDFPLINAHLDEDNIVKQRHINLGMAVSLPDNNLIVTVIHKAEELNFLGLVRQIADLAARARRGDLKPDEAAGSTFTITNPGLFGNLVGLPIINQPNVGILSVGAIKKRPVVWEHEGVDAIVIRSIMMLALGHDHRIIDGAYGAQFLERVVYYLETIKWETVI